MHYHSIIAIYRLTIVKSLLTVTLHTKRNPGFSMNNDILDLNLQIRLLFQNLGAYSDGLFRPSTKIFFQSK